MREATWEEILGRLDSVLDLCRSLRLEGAVAGSRFLKHRERLSSLIDRLNQWGQAAARELYDSDRLSHIVALTEAGEVAAIEPFLRACSPETIKPKLRHVLGGPVLPNEEDENSNQARNILFELNLAAKLSAGGLSPELGDRPDLTCEVEGKKLLIECKRPLTEQDARTRIRKAWTALQREARKEGPGVRGVIALSVTKLINPGGAIFSGANESDARNGLKNLLFQTTDLLSNAWGRPGTRVVGVIFHVITPAFLEDSKMLVLQQRTHGHGLARTDSLDWRAFRRLINHLESAWY